MLGSGASNSFFKLRSVRNSGRLRLEVPLRREKVWGSGQPGLLVVMKHRRAWGGQRRRVRLTYAVLEIVLGKKFGLAFHFGKACSHSSLTARCILGNVYK